MTRSRWRVMSTCIAVALLAGAGCGDGALSSANPFDRAEDSSDDPDAGTAPDLGEVQDVGPGDAGGDPAVDPTSDPSLGFDAPLDTDPSDVSDGSGDATDPPPLPDHRAPCENGACWETRIDAGYCSTAAINENFRTGRYNVHRYEATLFGAAANLLTLTRTGGDWQPALIVTDRAGTTLYDGEVGLVSSGLAVHGLDAGRSGDVAELEVVSDNDLDVYVFVTGWAVADGDFVPFLPTEATYRLGLRSVCDDSADLMAPAGALVDEQLRTSGTSALAIGGGADWGAPVRVDAASDEHIGFWLAFSPEGASVELELLAWDGREALSLGTTTAGPGIRVLAGFDPFRGRTFWVRARGGIGSGELTIVPTAIEAGARCTSSCDRLIQLPIPVDPVAQGFDLAPGNRFREQFGRKELMVALFHAGYRVAEAGYGPFEVQDISNWDGSQPCCHQTHTGGYHVDLSLLTAGGTAVWWDPGSAFGDEPMALLLAGFFEGGPYATGHPAEIILDSGMHDDVRAGADTLLERGEISAETRALFEADRDLIYHYRGHDNHIHVRIDR